MASRADCGQMQCPVPANQEIPKKTSGVLAFQPLLSRHCVWVGSPLDSTLRQSAHTTVLCTPSAAACMAPSELCNEQLAVATLLINEKALMKTWHFEPAEHLQVTHQAMWSGNCTAALPMDLAYAARQWNSRCKPLVTRSGNYRQAAVLY